MEYFSFTNNTLKVLLTFFYTTEIKFIKYRDSVKKKKKALNYLLS